MSIKTMKRDFERLLTKGVSLADMPIECSTEDLAKWLAVVNRKIDDNTTPEATSCGRRLNNFCLGSDPEFVFVSPGSAHKFNAADLGLKPGLAAGCDQNQRLAELRCWPSTSALEHVAGILATLRWMYRLYPSCRDLAWKAGGWHDNDGIGGHVHFGRKRPTRKEEVTGLDGVAIALRETGFFSKTEWQQRTRGDAHRQQYGMYGDTRPQIHGYEYRTLPSWLESPVRAFTVLTLSKLAVLDPEIPTHWVIKKDSWRTKDYFSVIRYLASYWAGRDDDAKLLQYILAEGNRKEYFHPWTTNSDFREAWGCLVPNSKLIDKPKSHILAACIQPHASEIEEIRSCLVDKTPLTFKENLPTFKNTIPEGYVWMYDTPIQRVNLQGVGDLVHNMVFQKKAKPQIGFGSDRFLVNRNVTKNWTQPQLKEIREMFPDMLIRNDMPGWVTLSREMTTVTLLQKTRKFLLKMGLFPLWTVNTVERDSYAKFQESQKFDTSKQPREEERIV